MEVDLISDGKLDYRNVKRIDGNKESPSPGQSASIYCWLLDLTDILFLFTTCCKKHIDHAVSLFHDSVLKRSVQEFTSTVTIHFTNIYPSCKHLFDIILIFLFDSMHELHWIRTQVDP